MLHETVVLLDGRPTVRQLWYAIDKVKKQNMKGELTLKVLERVKEGVEATGDLLAVFLTAGYGASCSRMEY